MFKYIQTIRRQFATNCLSVFDHFVELAFKVLMELAHPFDASIFISLWKL